MGTVTIDNVTKSYGAVEVLHGVSVDIADGEFVILVGPSGCGKSTLLRMIAGLEEITSGTVSVSGRVVNNLPPKERDIAMVFQSYALYPHMTVAENMGFSLKLARAPKSEKETRVAEAARILGLDQLLERYPRQLSGGQRQRVAMGRAIVRDPQVFLFDEPLSNLDAKLRVQMRSEIKALHQRLKTTIVYVTHDQIEAMTMADRIVVMNGGVIEQLGTPLELYDKPANTFVAEFIGSPSMNLVSGRVTGGRFVTPGGTAIALPDGQLRLHATTATLDHQPLPVSPSGLAVLRLLAERPGTVCSREQLLAVLPGESTDPHTAEMAVARLREAIGRSAVLTVVKRGYRLAVQEHP